MKVALITDPNGFPLIRSLGTSYHLPLAQYVLSDDAYAEFYKLRHDMGDFLIMDNGAAEEGTLTIDQLADAAKRIGADEVILPDVLKDLNATMAATTDDIVLRKIPARMRAVVPQGNDDEEWMICLQYFVDHMKFRTICIPKHAERFIGGRANLLLQIISRGWHLEYDIHLLGVWNNAFEEVRFAKAIYPYIRGIDTAAPFAWAQDRKELTAEAEQHISHKWGAEFEPSIAYSNCNNLLRWAGK